MVRLASRFVVYADGSFLSLCTSLHVAQNFRAQLLRTSWVISDRVLGLHSWRIPPTDYVRCLFGEEQNGCEAVHLLSGLV